MPQSVRVLTRFSALVLVGGLILGVCFAALTPGAREIALSHKYSATVKNLGQLTESTTVYDSQNNVIGKIGLQDREPAELDEVPQILIDAVISVEDQTFWKNPGIDVSGVSRAFVENFTKGKVSQGGSTITQQLVKNRILGNRQDLTRKAKELILAYRLNEKYSKREILKQYLNTVYFGQGSYGVKAAERRFFLTADPGSPFPRGKQLSEITVGEAALLAGVIRNPEGDNPFVHPDRAVKRRTEVLGIMVKQHVISQDQANFGALEPLPTVKPPAELKPANAWAEHAQQVLLSDPRLGATAAERRAKVLQGGLKVYTTLDQTMQQEADDSVARGLVGAAPGFGGALVAMDPKTGYVKAMVDSRPFGEAKFNLAVDGAGRQVGSSFKVVTLSTVLQNGYSRNDQVDGAAPCSVRGFDGSTRNSEGSGGPMSLDAATTGSVNCAFVRLSTSVGMEKVIEMAQKMGMRASVAGRQPPNEWRVLTFTLGVISVTPLEMATIGSTIASGGIRHDPVFVSKVVGGDGKVVFDETGRPGERVLDPDVAACAASILHGPLGPGGTAAGKGIPGHDAFGKTGTTDREVTSAFLGGTPDLLAFAWHGLPEADQPGAGFGAGVPNAMWRGFMTAALQGKPDAPFPTPGPACDAPGKVIDPLAGRTTDIPPPTLPPAPTPEPTPTPGPQAPPPAP
ncbi:MAG: transglycosylase domain-containing protein, partial [Actinomycetota bacterium]|nr:transglycosylase domain-containing protein [Actinomycetota bacterium]